MAAVVGVSKVWLCGRKRGVRKEWWGSLVTTIPRDVAKALNINVGDKIVYTVKDGKAIIEKLAEE